MPEPIFPPPILERESDLVADCAAVAERMGAYLMHVGQRKAKGSGTTVGYPDLPLVCSGHVVLIEVKRLKVEGEPGGRLSVGQEAVITQCASQGVKVHVVDTLPDFIAIVNGCRRCAP